jgi:FkbM family methyltransferase
MGPLRRAVEATVERVMQFPAARGAGMVCARAVTRAQWIGRANRGRMYNLIAGRAIPPTDVFTSVPVPGRTGASISLQLSLSDDLSRQWYYFGYDHYEVPVCRLLSALVADLAEQRPVRPFVLIDVGGNIGYYTLLLAALTRDDQSGHVHAFEPSPHVFQFLKRNVELNPGLPITLNEAAVCDHDGQQSLFMATEDFGHSSASLVKGSVAQVGSVAVKTTTMDSYVAGLSDSLVGLLKMDCEGVEAKVLAGMARTLERDSPHIVLEVLPRYPSLPDDLAVLPFFGRYRKFQITEDGLVEHDELRPSYQDRDWLLSIDPPARLFGVPTR